MNQGRKEIALIVNSASLFLSRNHFLKLSNICATTLSKRMSRGQLLSFKNGTSNMILNPCADFGKAWDALPALLTNEEACNFFCVKKLSLKLMKEIGFFSINGEKGLFVDKKSLSLFLEELL